MKQIQAPWTIDQAYFIVNTDRRGTQKESLMTRAEVLEEMVKIYEKYWAVVKQLGMLQMAEEDEQRLNELRQKLG